jgi:hypothetical protein
MIPGLLTILTAMAQDSQDEDAYYREQADALLAESLRRAPRGEVVVYLDCNAPTCEEAVPYWFSVSAFVNAMDDVLDDTPGLTSGGALKGTWLSVKDYTPLDSPGQPDARFAYITSRLSGHDNLTFVYLWPEAQTDALLLRWRTSAPPSPVQRGDITLHRPVATVAPAPAVIPIAPVGPMTPLVSTTVVDVTREGERRSVQAGRLVGGGLILAGTATVVATTAAYLKDPTIIAVPADTPKLLRTPVLLNTLGWTGLAAGAGLVFIW